MHLNTTLARNLVTWTEDARNDVVRAQHDIEMGLDPAEHAQEARAHLRSVIDGAQELLRELGGKEHPAGRILAAQEAERVYLGECSEKQRRQSLALFGHRGAHIPSAQPDDHERVRRMLEAADEERR